MTEDEVTIVATGDLHLGRRPTRIPSELDGPQFSPSEVWRSTVDAALDRAADVVVISGDVIDRENRYFEAFGPFESGVNQLGEADIPVVVVAGNHDFDVLPDLVENVGLSNLSLLGTDGIWERISIPGDDTPVLHIDGWSFPDEHVLESPIESYDLDVPDAPSLGMVHGDLDTTDSDYAPIASSDLEATGLDAWVLGHIHHPAINSHSDPLTFYPGSPQPLDPGETEGHGPWVVHLSGSGEPSIEQLPLSTIQYEALEIDVGGIESANEVPGVFSDRVDDHITANVDTRSLGLLLVRARLTGRTEAHGELVQRREEMEAQLAFKHTTLPVRVDTVEVATVPAVDLSDLAQDDSPVAYLAELLLTIDEGTVRDTQPELVRDAEEALREAYTAGPYAPLRREGEIDEPDSERAIDVLDRQARLLLHELRGQTEEHR